MFPHIHCLHSWAIHPRLPSSPMVFPHNHVNFFAFPFSYYFAAKFPFIKRNLYVCLLYLFLVVAGPSLLPHILCSQCAPQMFFAGYVLLIETIVFIWQALTFVWRRNKIKEKNIEIEVGGGEGDVPTNKLPFCHSLLLWHNNTVCL